MIFSVLKFSEILKRDSSRPRHLTSLRLYYIQGLRFGQSIEPCGVTGAAYFSWGPWPQRLSWILEPAPQETYSWILYDDMQYMLYIYIYILYI